MVIVTAAVSIIFTILNFSGFFSNNPEIINGVKVGTDIGDRAPDFTVTTSDGKTVRLNDLTKYKKPVVIYFWATWCPFCRDEFNKLDSIYPKYKNKVKFLAVDLDTSESLQMVADYKTAHNHDWMFAIGNDDILRKYHIVSTTTKYIIDANGIIQTKGVGVISEDKLDSAFKIALGQI